MSHPIITLSMPVWGRPERTMRAIESIMAQNINNWEALVIGDGCALFKEFCESHTAEALRQHARNYGNSLVLWNTPDHCGGYGYNVINSNIRRATGEYFVFLSNDDYLEPNHFKNYLATINGTDVDFVVLDSYVHAWKGRRTADLEMGSVGHSEIIVRTEFLKKMPPHNDAYGHDWVFINSMITSGGKYKKMYNNELTYKVMSVPTNLEVGID